MLVKIQIKKIGAKPINFKAGRRDVVEATALEVGEHPFLSFIEYQFNENDTRQATSLKTGDVVTIHVESMKAGFQNGTVRFDGPVLEWPAKK